METEIRDDALPVRRRRVFYVPGYDPRRPSTYRQTFAQELEKAAYLRHYSAEAGPLDETDAVAPSFVIRASFEGAPVEAQVSILRWDDLVRPVYKQPLLARLPMLLRVGFDLLRRGVIAKVARLDWQFAAFLAYPYAMTLMAIMLIAVVGLGGGILVGRELPIAALPVAMVAGGLVAWFWLRIERTFYLRYLLEDWHFSFAHERGADSSLAERLDDFARRIVEAAADPDLDELLLVGHSSGSFLAPETLARALEMNPKLGEGRVAISLLTIGALASLFLCDGRTSRFGKALSRLAEEPGIIWCEVQSRHDVMNMCPVDPVAVSGQFPDRVPQWPQIFRLSMTQVVAPGQLGLFRERLRFFKTHFRFVAANERTEWYDFYGMVAGPGTLSVRFRGQAPVFRRDGKIAD